MKRFLQISVRKRAVGEAAFAKICALVPEGAQRVTFGARLHEADPRLPRVLATLEGSDGKRAEPWDPSALNHYSVWPNYEYEPADFIGVRYFQPTPETHTPGLYRDDDGVALLQIEGLVRNAAYASTGGPQIVSDAFRRELESARLRGLVCRPTRGMLNDYHDREVVPWERTEGLGPFWESTADITLPPLSPRMRLLASDGSPVQRGETTQGLQAYEGQFPAGELHYLRSELDTVEPFDMALTRERFGPTAEDELRRLVVSLRFKELCDRLGLAVYWLPVYVDEM